MRVCLTVFLTVFGFWGMFPGTTDADQIESPSRVLIIGDSMMRVTAHALELQISRREGVTSRAFTSLGSGISRLDVFDWMEKIDELVSEFSPDCTIAWFGTNDRQPLRTEGGIIRPDSPEWEVEYARRVGEAMDKLLAMPESNVLWLELPDMRESRLQEDVDLINQIVQREAAKRARAHYYPTRSLLSRRPGTFSMHIVGPTGMPLQIRDSDGVHLNRTGADRMAESIINFLFENSPMPKGN